jgi:hypothetical protein
MSPACSLTTAAAAGAWPAPVAQTGKSSAVWQIPCSSRETACKCADAACPDICAAPHADCCSGSECRCMQAAVALHPCSCCDMLHEHCMQPLGSIIVVCSAIATATMPCFVCWQHSCMQQAAGAQTSPPAAYLAGSCLQLRDLLANVHAILLGHFTHLQGPCVTRAAMRSDGGRYRTACSLPP